MESNTAAACNKDIHTRSDEGDCSTIILYGAADCQGERRLALRGILESNGEEVVAMAVKYTREGLGSTRATYWRAPRIRSRLIYIYVGLSFVAALLIAYSVFIDGELANEARAEAHATVLEKSTVHGDGAQPRFRVVLEVVLPAGDRVETSLYTDERSWSVLLPGDDVVVTLDRQATEGGLRIQSMRMDAGATNDTR
jgi:hypothetical protein